MAATTSSVGLPNAASALRRVLDTQELREAIILRLPIKDILIKAPLVCKDWNATIKASPRLRKALFFEPVAGKPLKCLESGWAEDEHDVHAYTVWANPWFHMLFRWMLFGISFGIMETHARLSTSNDYAALSGIREMALVV
ncbi:hypothetical protein LTR27_004634 [Elasticomyces elasticus]|nr:hypothetical protein LTR27_004634 [Elasticomyces elasticus]